MEPLWSTKASSDHFNGEVNSFENEVIPLELNMFGENDRYLVVGWVDGRLDIFDTSKGFRKVFKTMECHRKSIRSVIFSKDDHYAFTASADRNIKKWNTHRWITKSHSKGLVWKQTKAHTCPINAMTKIDENVIVTGDDRGTIRLWDHRLKDSSSLLMEYSSQRDFISSIVYVETKKKILCTSGDGTLAVYDHRKKSPVALSENMEDGLTCLALMKHGRKIVTGTEGGFLNIFDWGNWMEYSDRLVGHKSTIDCLFPLNDSMLLTGSSDGIIRVVNILPNSIVGFLGNHGSHPIECLFVNHDKTKVFSCGHDGLVKMWNLNGFLNREHENSDSDQDETELSTSQIRLSSRFKKGLYRQDLTTSTESTDTTALSPNDEVGTTSGKLLLSDKEKPSSESRFFFKSKKAKLNSFFSGLL